MPPTRTTPPSEAETDKAGPPVAATHLPRTTSETHRVTLANPSGDAPQPDDDWGQAGTLVREVMDDDARARLLGNISGHLLNGVSEPVLALAFQYWTNVDAELGKKVEESVRSQQSEEAPTTGQSPTAPHNEAAKV